MAKNEWIDLLTKKFLQYRGNCVIYVDWDAFSFNLDLILISKTYAPNVAKALARRLFKLEDEGVLVERFFIYGHSVGARIAISTGLALGGRIPFIDGKNYYCFELNLRSLFVIQLLNRLLLAL